MDDPRKAGMLECRALLAKQTKDFVRANFIYNADDNTWENRDPLQASYVVTMDDAIKLIDDLIAAEFGPPGDQTHG